MNKKIDINEIKRRLKSILKNRISINNKTLIAFMIAGFLGLSEVVYSLEGVYINYETGATGVGKNWTETWFWEKGGGKGNILLAPTKSDSAFVKKYNGINTNIENSVVIGLNSGAVNNERFMTVVGDGAIALKTGATALGAQANANDKGTAVGYGSKAIGSQGTALGNNAYAAGQGTALGSDVMAAGFSSIAIGNDDIKTKFTDKLPEETIMEIYGYKNTSGTDLITYKSILNEQQFKEKYGIVGSTDNRIYSPTYAAGVGAIAIGSRSVGYGNASLAMGTLSFALADRSTAVGVRAFVGLGADGATAIGDSSRVFASNSYAIGNSAESTAEGSLSFGSDAKAVGVGSIAIGPNVSSNAKLTDDSANVFKNKISSEAKIGTVNEIDKWNDGTDISVTVSNLKVGNQNEVVQSGFLANNRNGKNKITDLINNITTTTTGGKKENNKFSYEKEQNIEITTTEEIKKTKKEGDHSVSLGYHISNNGDNTIAIGTASYVRGANSVVLGALNNVGKYAINTVAIGVGTNVHKENSVAIGTGTTVVGAGVVAIGSGVGVTKDNTIALGYGTLGESSESVVLGNDAKLKTHSKKSIIIGNGAEVENKSKDEKISEKVGLDQEDYKSGKKELEMSAISIGTNSHVYSEKGVALGDSAKIEENSSDAIAIGTNAKVNSNVNRGIAIGNESEVTLENSTALGVNSTTDYTKEELKAKPYSVKGSLNIPTSTKVGVISVGSKSNERRIVNVAAGYRDSDAVNVSQLKGLEERVNLIATNLGDNVTAYFGVEQKNINSEARIVSDSIEKEKNYKKYVFLTGEYIKLLNRQKHNGEEFNPETIKEIKDEIAKLRKIPDIGTTANKITKILDELEKASINENEKTYDGKIKEIELAIEEDKKKTVSTLSEEKIKKSNYKGEGAQGLDSIAVGYEANTKSEAKHSVALGYKASAEKEDSIALGSNSVADRGNKKIGFDTVTGSNRANINGNDENNYGAWKSKYGALSIGNGNNTRQITGVAAGTEDTDAVNVAQLKNATLHYVSVKNPSSNGVNYNNNGATKEGAIAIGVGAQSNATNAVVIGKNVSINVPNSFVLGSDNTVTQNDTNVNHAVVVMGSGTTLRNSRASIAIGAVKASNGQHIKDNSNIIGTLIENSEWATVIGNKATIYNATDSLALGNNIKVYANKTEVNKTQKANKKNNNSLIIIGNGAKAAQAGDSVVIGAEAKALNGNETEHEYKEVKNSVVIGKGATTKVSGAVAIGSGSKVEEAAGDSIAIGKESEATAKETAQSSATINDKNVKFTFGGGVSSDTNDNSKKAVFSVGKSGKERIIKNVAAGEVSARSTDAINGSQLYAVADEFSKLAIDVLGAEADTTSGFKKSTFTKLKTSSTSGEASTVQPGGATQATSEEKTFKKAIEDNIAKLNSGFIFGVGDGNTEQGTHYLGDKLIIKAGNTKVKDTSLNKEYNFVRDNIKTAYLPTSKEILIGIKEEPIFKKVTLSTKQTYGGTDKAAVGENDLISRYYLDKALENVASSFTVAGDVANSGNEKSFKIDDALNINGDSSNITTKVDATDKKLIVALKENLTGINSIGKDENNKIEFNTNNTIIKLGGVDLSLNKNSTAVKISNVANGVSDNDAINKSQLASVVTALGGNAAIGGDGNITGPNYSINGENKTNIGEALTALDTALKGKTFKVKVGSNINNTSDNLIGGELEFANGSNLNVALDKSAKKITYSLNSELSGITSVGNDVNSKIEFKNGTGRDNKKSIVLTAGDASKAVTLTGDKFSGVSEITNKENGNSKLILSDNKATITTGEDAGSIKITSDNSKKIELSPEKNITLTLQKDNTNVATSNHVKATGLSTVGLNDDNILTFKNKIDNNPIAELKVGGATLTFTPTNGTVENDKKVKISNVASGIGEDSNNELLGKILSGSGYDSIKNNAVNIEDLSKVAKQLKNNVDTATITYKSNGGGQKEKRNDKEINEYTIGLSKGLDFKNTDNITVSVGENGEIKHELNNNLKKIDSIQSGTDAKSAKITLTSVKDNEKSKIEFTLGTNGGTATKYEFNDEGLDLASKKITNLASGIGTTTSSNGGDAISNVGKVLSGSEIDAIQNNAVNVKDLSDVAKAIISKGIQIKGNNSSAEAQTLALGNLLTIDSSDAKYKEENEEKTIKDIETSISSDADGAKLTLKLNKSDKVQKDDDRVITSKAVEAAISTVKDTIKALDSDVVKYDSGSEKGSITLGGISDTGEMTKPVQISNLKSGLDIVDDSTDKKYAVLDKIKADKALSILLTNANADSLHKAVNVTDLQALAISGMNFKGNDENGVHKKLSETLEIKGQGLNKKQTSKFKGTNGNIAVKNNAGKLEISLSEKISGIKKIENGKYSSIEFNANDKQGLSKTIKNLILTGNGTKMVLSHKGIHVNEKQLIGLKSGLLENRNGQDKDRKDLEYLIGAEFNNSSIKNKAVNVGDLAKISKEIVERGYKFSSDITDATNTTKSHHLGSTISFNRLADSAGTSGISTQIDINAYKGDNLITRYNYNSGNAKIEIGFKDAPTFSNITLTGTQAYDGSRGNDVITKKYLEEALDKFKINVKTDSKDSVALGRGDTLELAKGSNIDIKLTTPTKSLAPSTPASPAPAAPTAGTNAGSSLSVPSAKTVTATVGVVKELKDLKSAEFISNDNGSKVKTTVNSEGTKIEEVDKTNGKSAEYKLGGSKLSDGTNTLETNEKGISLKYKASDASSSEKEVFAIKNEAEKVTVDFKNKDGKITGLADIADNEPDGSIATNKAYVDGKVGNVPVVYKTKDDKDVVVGKDGKKYKQDDIKGKTFVKDSGYYSSDQLENGKPKSGVKAIESLSNSDVVVAVKGEALQLTNVASGLEIGENAKETQDKITEAKKKVDELQADKSKEKELKEAKENLAKLEKELEEQEKGLDKVKALVADGKEGLSNVATVRDLKAIGQAGINVVGNDGKVHNVKISDTLYIKGEGTTDSSFTSAANNIRVDNTKEGMTIRLSDKLDNMKSITFKNNDGVIRGLKAPTDDFDATNKAYVDSKFGETKQLANEALGGVAGAIAMANLVQANSFSDYRHQLSAAFGTYSGKQAIAVGYSGTTDSGRLVYKLSGSVDSGGKLGIGAGIGIMLGEKIQHTYPKNITEKLTKLEKENNAMKNKFENIQKENESIKKENIEMKNKFENMQKENAEIKKMLEKLLKDKK